MRLRMSVGGSVYGRSSCAVEEKMQSRNPGRTERLFVRQQWKRPDFIGPLQCWPRHRSSQWYHVTKVVVGMYPQPGAGGSSRTIRSGRPGDWVLEHDSGRSTTAPAPVFNLSDHLKADPVGDLQPTHCSIAPSCINAPLNSKDVSARMAVHSKTNVKRSQLCRVFPFFRLSRKQVACCLNSKWKKCTLLAEDWVKDGRKERKRASLEAAADRSGWLPAEPRDRWTPKNSHVGRQSQRGRQKSCVTLFRASNSFT